jgi:DNA-binding HxlR family transcriptional regulator
MGRDNEYGQFCPVAQAAGILAERWTPLVVRELLCGSVRFNDLQRGVPRMSSSLLSRRLKELQYAGIVERRRGRTGFEYHLTPAGRELFPVVEAMGLWAHRWLRHANVGAEKLDPNLLMWDIRRRVTAQSLKGDSRFVAEFQFTGTIRGHRYYWLVFDKDQVDLCLKDPGFDVDLFVFTPLRTLTQVWLGYVGMDQAMREGHLRFEGAARHVSAFRSWFALSMFAPSSTQRNERSRTVDAPQQVAHEKIKEDLA